VYQHLDGADDDEEIKRKATGNDSSNECSSRSDRHQKKESKYTCQGVIKAHELPVNSIRVFEHNGAVSFVTSSDDMLIKIFSL
jgi:hypothetical protein